MMPIWIAIGTKRKLGLWKSCFILWDYLWKAQAKPLEFAGFGRTVPPKEPVILLSTEHCDFLFLPVLLIEAQANRGSVLRSKQTPQRRGFRVFVQLGSLRLLLAMASLELPENNESCSSLHVPVLCHVCAYVCMLVCYYFIPEENKGSPHAFCQHKGALFSLTWFSIISSSLISSLTSLSVFAHGSFLAPLLWFASLSMPLKLPNYLPLNLTQKHGKPPAVSPAYCNGVLLNLHYPGLCMSCIVIQNIIVLYAMGISSSYIIHPFVQVFMYFLS